MPVVKILLLLITHWSTIMSIGETFARLMKKLKAKKIDRVVLADLKIALSEFGRTGETAGLVSVLETIKVETSYPEHPLEADTTKQA